MAITNSALTALLGLGLLHWARKWRAVGLSPIQFLRLRRFVLLAALYKGAVYLLMGTSLRGLRHQPLIYGLQIPDPRDLIRFGPSSTESIWYPTAATKEVSLLLLGLSFGFLIARMVQLVRTRHALNILLRLQADAPPFRIPALLRRAAAALALPTGFALPRVILAEVDHPTPLLLGVCHPYLLLSPALAAVLTDGELELAFRHELAHYQRHDHWWRWLFTWLEDVGRLNLLSSRFGVLALDLEEELCDRRSVQSPRDALVLATAIRKTVSFYQDLFSLGIPSPSDESTGICAARPPATAVPAAAQDNEVKGRQAWDQAIPAGPGGPDERHPAPHCDSLTRRTASHPDKRSLPDRVLPALLGRHTRKWSRRSSLRKRLQDLLALSEELSHPHPPDPARDLKPHALRGFRYWIKTAARVGLRFGFGVLLFAILYTKFYVALTLAPLPQ